MNAYGILGILLASQWKADAIANWQYSRNEKNTARTMDQWLAARHDMRIAAADYAAAREWSIDFSEYEPKPGRE